jgi:glutaryl-CoA dehydrogenase (non-decarboxylating)
MNSNSVADDQLNTLSHFLANEIQPLASEHDIQEKISTQVIQRLGQKKILGALISSQYTGLEMDYQAFGRLNFELGKTCTAVRSLVTVQSMVGGIFERWGTDDQKQRWLPLLANGHKIAGFALTEPEFGSDAAGIQTTFKKDADGFIVNGEKKWISFGQIADLFLVFGQADRQMVCLVIERDTKGLKIEPIKGILGARGSMLARLTFQGCRVPKTHLVGSLGFGLHPVGFTGLDIGRLSIAWGCVGMAQACLETAAVYSRQRVQFGSPLKDHQLIQAMLTDMMVQIKAAKTLCEKASLMKDTNHRLALQEVMAAKYFASNMAVEISGKAVEILGANGYSKRFFSGAVFQGCQNHADH